MKKTERIIIVDLLKLLAIFLVVWGHCMQHFLSIPTQENAMFLWISSFHMPLFMALAGMFAEKTFSRSWSHYFVNRSRQLLLPWISWTIIIAILLYLLDENKSLNDVIVLFVNSLWFLKSLFICGMLALIGFKLPGKRSIWILISIAISQIFLYWNIYIMYPCFLFGLYCAKQMDYITKNKSILAIISGVIFLVLSIWVANTPDFWMRGLGVKQMLLTGEISLSKHALFLISLVVRRYCQLIIGCIGSIFFISFFKVLFEPKSSEFYSSLALFGQYTLGVYLIQSVIVETIMPHFLAIPIELKMIFNLLIAPCISIVVIAIALYINILIQNRGGVSLYIFIRNKTP